MFPQVPGALARPQIAVGIKVRDLALKPLTLPQAVPQRPAAPASSSGPAPRTRSLAALGANLPHLQSQLDRGHDALVSARERRQAEIAACPYSPGWHRDGEVAAVLSTPSRDPVNLDGGADAEKCSVCGLHHLYVALAVGGRILFGCTTPNSASRTALYGGHASGYAARVDALLRHRWFHDSLRRPFDAQSSVENLRRRTGMSEQSNFLLHVNRLLFAHNPRWNVLQEQEGWRQHRSSASRSNYATLHDLGVCLSYPQQAVRVNDQRSRWPALKALLLVSHAYGHSALHMASDNCQLQSIASLEGAGGAGTRKFVRMAKKIGVEGSQSKNDGRPARLLYRIRFFVRAPFPPHETPLSPSK